MTTYEQLERWIWGRPGEVRQCEIQFTMEGKWQCVLRSGGVPVGTARGKDTMKEAVEGALPL